MITSGKLLTIFVILIYSVSVSTQKIYKIKRLLRRPIRVEAPVDYSNTPSENKYLPLTAIYTVEDEEVPKNSSEETESYEKKLHNVVDGYIGAYHYNGDKDSTVPNEGFDRTESYEKDLNNKQDDSEPQVTSPKRTQDGSLVVPVIENYDYAHNEHYNYRGEDDKQQPKKSNGHEEILDKHDNNKTPTTFPKRTEDSSPVVPIIESENYVYAYHGDYHYSYKGGDGTQAFERGGISRPDNGAAEDFVEGGYSYKDKDGNDYSITYTAGENGYRPVGAHLPTPPPIPPAILRVLRILATKTTPEPVTESLNNYDYN